LQVLAYGLAGFGYIITATFLPVIARQALPNSVWPDFFWRCSVCVWRSAPFGATRFPVHYDQRKLLAASYLTQACGVLISAVFPNEVRICSEQHLARFAIYRNHAVCHA